MLPYGEFDPAEAYALILQEQELQLLARARRLIEKGGDSVDPAHWTSQKLAQLRAEVAKLEGKIGFGARAESQALTAAMGQYYAQEGMKQAIEAAGRNGRYAVTLPPAQRQAVEAIISDMQGRVEGLQWAVLRNYEDSLREVVAQVAPSVLLGTQTRLQATQVALDRWFEGGVTGFVDSAGRNWSMAAYGEMSVRTAGMNAAVQGHLGALQDLGQDLVYIIPSPWPCEICDQWAGEVLYIGSGASEYPAMDQARAEGLFHPNCRCSTGVYIPGISNTETARAVDADYEADQRQREIERNIRKWKRREALATTPQAKGRARQYRQRWQDEMQNHLDANPELMRKRQREGNTRAERQFTKFFSRDASWAQTWDSLDYTLMHGPGNPFPGPSAQALAANPWASPEAREWYRKSARAGALGLDGTGRFGERGLAQVGKLSARVEAALRDYQGVSYDWWNEALRSGDMSRISPKTQTMVADLADTISNGGEGVIANKKEYTTWRRVSHDLANDPTWDLPAGSSFTERGFMSTSADEDFARSFGGMSRNSTLLEIQVPPGVNVLPVDWALGDPWEHELLFAPGTKMEVQDRYWRHVSGKESHERPTSGGWEQVLIMRIVRG